MTRNEQIREDRKTGMSYEKIAEKYMLTEDYVRDICKSRCKRVGGYLQLRNCYVDDTRGKE